MVEKRNIKKKNKNIRNGVSRDLGNEFGILAEERNRFNHEYVYF